MRSIQLNFVLLVSLASLWLTHAMPSSKDSDQKSEAQKLQNLKGDLEWESKWWTPQEKDSVDSKDSWKVFKTEKPVLRRRWWEEDWDEDQWWDPKDSSNTNSVSSKKSSLNDKQGEAKTDSSNKDEKLDTNPPADRQQTETEKIKPVPEPKALPLISDAKLVQSENADFMKKNDHSAEKSTMVNIPEAESPREKVDPVVKGDVMISPFEDPKPPPFSLARDEVPSQEKWEYHQLSGFGKYIDQSRSKEVEKGNEKVQKKNTNEPQKRESLTETTVPVDNKLEKEENKKVMKTPEEEKPKFTDQFYGFGLESQPASISASDKKNSPLPNSAGVESKKENHSVRGKENYNKGIIYDAIPGAPDLTHSVKKDLGNSEYMSDFVSTKANLQTSPNPPPPGIAKGETDSETTPLAPSKLTIRSENTKFFIKSHPLTFCKLDEECRKGRMCRNGMCVCLPDDGCVGHHKPVCGSDGVEYPSHCELHRTACVRHVHIKLDHSGSCFMKHEKVKEMLKIQIEDHKDHMLSQSSKQSVSKDGDNDDDDDASNSDSEDDEEYSYEDEEDEFDDDDDFERWLEDKPKKVTEDSKKVSGSSQDLGNASTPNAEQSGNKMDTSHVQEKTSQEFQGKVSKPEDTEDHNYQSDGGYKECTKKELAKFKRQLLLFHCKRFEEPNCKLEVKEEIEYLTNLMFSYLDMNTDYQLSYDELKSRQQSEHFQDLNNICKLTDLIWYDDILNADARLSLDEFEQAFNHLDVIEEQKLPELAKITPSSPSIHIIPTLATVGNGLELKCGLTAKGADVVWRRHGINIHDLAMTELLVLDDGSLFFSKMGVHHMGNYSCEDSTDASVLQVHSLKVQMPPIVKVSPHSQIEPSMTDVKIRCHAEGVPKPTISWQMNNDVLHKEPHHYALEDNNEQLIVYKADYQRDTGAYKCLAKNQAGTSDDVSSLFIIGDKERTVGMGFTNVNSGKFAVFHSQGYTAYNPDDCLKYRSVHGDFGYFKFIPDNLDGPLRLCNERQDCSWGMVVNIKNSFLYISQPAMNRVVIIETSKNWIPIQVIATDKQPMQLHYVEHLDQVWVLCWNGEEDESTKTIVVIRDASKYVQHRAVHTQPVGNHFDQIQSLFIAPTNDLRHSFDYGYVTHNGQHGLTKLDLDNMRYTKAVDLSAYDCVPRSLAFVPIGGHVVVECVSPVNHQTVQLVMDYITDAVVSTAVLSGRPYVSPDSRHVVTVDDLTGKVSVAGVNNEGTLEAAYEVTVSASISDVAFFPASGHGYLLVLTSADDDDIITINLSTGKVDKMKGTNRLDTSSDWHPSPVKRAITSGDIFTDYLLAPSKSSISIIDMKFRQVKCEFMAAPPSKAAVFVGHQ